MFLTVPDVGGDHGADGLIADVITWFQRPQISARSRARRRRLACLRAQVARAAWCCRHAQTVHRRWRVRTGTGGSTTGGQDEGGRQGEEGEPAQCHGCNRHGHTARFIGSVVILVEGDAVDDRLGDLDQGFEVPRDRIHADKEVPAAGQVEHEEA